MIAVKMILFLFYLACFILIMTLHDIKIKLAVAVTLKINNVIAKIHGKYPGFVKVSRYSFPRCRIEPWSIVALNLLDQKHTEN